MSVKVIVSLAGSNEAMSEHVFDKEFLTVGRTLGNEIVLPDVEKKVSSKHARLERKGAAYEIIDLGSTNGTYLNGRKIDPNRPVTLANGDKVLIGGFQLAFQASDDRTESTTRHVDPTKAAEKLAESLAQEYAKHLHDPADVRREALCEAVREGLRFAGPESGRTVLTLVRSRFQGTAKGGGPNEEVTRQEELYRSGYQAMSNLSTHFLGEANFQSAEQMEKFTRQILQVLDLSLEWVANMLKGRREFENQFQADLTMVFSKEGNPLKSSGSTNEMARHLLDWRSAKDTAQQKAILEGVFKDIAMHQLGLVAGAQACLKKLLERLDPKVMEQEVKGKVGFLGSLEKKVWEVYGLRHKEMFEENSKLFNELIYPNLREGYLKAHAGEGAAGKTIPSSPQSKPTGQSAAAPKTAPTPPSPSKEVPPKEVSVKQNPSAPPKGESK